MIFIVNLEAIICLALVAAIYGGVAWLFPEVAHAKAFLIISTSILIIGQMAEVFYARPRIYTLPLRVVGLILTPFAIWNVAGFTWFAVTMVVSVEICWLLMAVQEVRAWEKARVTLFEYERLGSAEPDLHGVMLEQSLFQNFWTRGTEAQVKHNKRVISHMLWDPAMRLSEKEILLLQHVRGMIEAGEDVILWNWRLNYIANLKRQLIALQSRREFGDGRVSV